LSGLDLVRYHIREHRRYSRPIQFVALEPSLLDEDDTTLDSKFDAAPERPLGPIDEPAAISDTTFGGYGRCWTKLWPDGELTKKCGTAACQLKAGKEFCTICGFVVPDTPFAATPEDLILYLRCARAKRRGSAPRPTPVSVRVERQNGARFHIADVTPRRPGPSEQWDDDGVWLLDITLEKKLAADHEIEAESSLGKFWVQLSKLVEKAPSPREHREIEFGNLWDAQEDLPAAAAPEISLAAIDASVAGLKDCSTALLEDFLRLVSDVWHQFNPSAPGHLPDNLERMPIIGPDVPSLPSLPLPSVGPLPIDPGFLSPVDNIFQVPWSDLLANLAQNILDAGLTFAEAVVHFLNHSVIGLSLATSVLRVAAFIMRNATSRCSNSVIRRSEAHVRVLEALPRDIGPVNMHYGALFHPPVNSIAVPPALLMAIDSTRSHGQIPEQFRAQYGLALQNVVDGVLARPTINVSTADRDTRLLQATFPEFLLRPVNTAHPHPVLHAARDALMRLAVAQVRDTDAVHCVGASVPQLHLIPRLVHNCAPILSGRDAYRQKRLGTEAARDIFDRFSCSNKFETCQFVGGTTILAPFSTTSIHRDDFIKAMIQRGAHRALVLTHLPTVLLDERVDDYVDLDCHLTFRREGNRIATTHNHGASAGYFDDATAMLSWCKPLPAFEGYHCQVESFRAVGTLHLLELRVERGCHEPHPLTIIQPGKDFIVLPYLRPYWQSENRPKHFAMQAKRFNSLVNFISTLEANKIAFAPIANKLRGQLAEVRIGKDVLEERLDLNHEQFYSVVGCAITAADLSAQNYQRVITSYFAEIDHLFNKHGSYKQRWITYYKDLFTFQLHRRRDPNTRSPKDRLLDWWFATKLDPDDLPFDFNARNATTLYSEATFPAFETIRLPVPKLLPVVKSVVTLAMSVAKPALALPPLAGELFNSFGALTMSNDTRIRRGLSAVSRRTPRISLPQITRSRYIAVRRPDRAAALRRVRALNLLSLQQALVDESRTLTLPLPVDELGFDPIARRTEKKRDPDAIGLDTSAPLCSCIMCLRNCDIDLAELNIVYKPYYPPHVHSGDCSRDMLPHDGFTLDSLTPVTTEIRLKPVRVKPPDAVLAALAPPPARERFETHPWYTSMARVEEMRTHEDFAIEVSDVESLDENASPPPEPPMVEDDSTVPRAPGNHPQAIVIPILATLRAPQNFSPTGNLFADYANASVSHRRFREHCNSLEELAAILRPRNFSIPAPDFGLAMLIEAIFTNVTPPKTKTNIDSTVALRALPPEPNIGSDEHAFWKLSSDFSAHVPAGIIRAPMVFINGVAGSAKSSAIRSWLREYKRRALIVVPTRELASQWQRATTLAGVSCEIVTFYHRPRRQNFDVVIIDEAVRFSALHLRLWSAYATHRPVILVGDTMQVGSASGDCIEPSSAMLTRRVINFTVSNTMPMDALFLALSAFRLPLDSVYQTRSTVDRSIRVVEETDNDFTDFDLVMNMRTTDPCPNGQPVVSVAQAQGSRAKHAVFYYVVSPKATAFLTSNPGQFVVMISRHSRSLTVVCDSTKIHTLFGNYPAENIPHGRRMIDRVTVAAPLDYEFVLVSSATGASAAAAADVRIEDSYSTGEVLLGVCSSLEARIWEPPATVAAPTLSECQAFIYSGRDFDLPQEHEVIDFVQDEMPGLLSIGEPGLLLKKATFRSVFSEVNKLVDVQLSSCAWTDTDNVCKRQFFNLQDYAGFSETMSRSDLAYERFRQCFYNNSYDLHVVEPDAIARWFATRSSNFTGGWDDSAFGETAKTLDRVVFAKTQTKAKATPGFAATLPKGQGVTTNSNSYGVRFAQAAALMYRNLPKLMRDGVYLDFGLSDLELETVLSESGALDAFTAFNVQLDVSRQDATHTPSHVGAFLRIALDCGVDEETMRLYFETVSEYRVKAMHTGRYRGIQRFNLASGDPFTLIRNVIQMLTTVACRFEGFEQGYVLQKGDDMLTTCPCSNAHPAGNSPDMQIVELKIERDLPPYHAGRFFLNNRVHVDPVRAVLKHFSRLYDPLVPVADLFDAYISRARRPTETDLAALLPATAGFYPDLAPEDVEFCVRTYCCLFDSRFFFSTMTTPELSPPIIDPERDCAYIVARSLFPHLPKKYLADTLRLCTVRQAFEFFESRLCGLIPVHVVPDRVSADGLLGVILISSGHVLYVPPIYGDKESLLRLPCPPSRQSLLPLPPSRLALPPPPASSPRRRPSPMWHLLAPPHRLNPLVSGPSSCRSVSGPSRTKLVNPPSWSDLTKFPSLPSAGDTLRQWSSQKSSFSSESIATQMRSSTLLSSHLRAGCRAPLPNLDKSHGLHQSSHTTIHKKASGKTSSRPLGSKLISTPTQSASVTRAYS
jgi:hypothetical protein